MPLWISIALGIIGAIVGLALLPMAVAVSIYIVDRSLPWAIRIVVYPIMFVAQPMIHFAENAAWKFVPNPNDPASFTKDEDVEAA